MSAKVYPPRRKKGRPIRGHKPEAQHEAKPNGRSAMQAMAAREIAHHTAPLPEAQPPARDPFPRPVMLALALGAGLGAVLGLLFGALLQSYALTIAGWEALYSMGPFTFHVFWALMGLALGALVVGVGAILAYPAKPAQN